MDEIRESDRKRREQENARDTLLTQTEAAKYLHRDKSTLRRWCKMGYLRPAARIGTGPMYSKADLDAIINNERKDNEEPNQRSPQL